MDKFRRVCVCCGCSLSEECAHPDGVDLLVRNCKLFGLPGVKQETASFLWAAPFVDDNDTSLPNVLLFLSVGAEGPFRPGASTASAFH